MDLMPQVTGLVLRLHLLLQQPEPTPREPEAELNSSSVDIKEMLEGLLAENPVIRGIMAVAGIGLLAWTGVKLINGMINNSRSMGSVVKGTLGGVMLLFPAILIAILTTAVTGGGNLIAWIVEQIVQIPGP
jgi:hypothetical protein